MNLTGRVFCLRRKGRPWKRDSLRTTKRASWTTSTSSSPSRPSSCSSRSPPSSPRSPTTTDGTSSTGWPSGRLHAKAGDPFKNDITESLRCSKTVQRDLSRAIRKREKSKSDGSSAYLYDAFLSFNESDHDLVYDHLAPHLEDRHGTG